LYKSFIEQAKTFASKRNEAFISGNKLRFAECSNNAIYFNELAGYVEELRLYRLHYDKAAERIEKKMKESNDYVVINNKRYVSYSELCEILEGKDILKEGE
jgi:hypothetical protein